MKATAPFDLSKASILSVICSNDVHVLSRDKETYVIWAFQPFWPLILRPLYSLRRYGLGRPQMAPSEYQPRDLIYSQSEDRKV